MIDNQLHLDMLTSPSRSIISWVGVYEYDAVNHSYGFPVEHENFTQHTYIKALRDFTVSRAGANKFFGFGIGQEITLHLLDPERKFHVRKDQYLCAHLEPAPHDGTFEELEEPFPYFLVTEVTQDETTNELTVKGVDKLYKARNHTLAELGLTPPYLMNEVVVAIARFLDITQVRFNQYTILVHEGGGTAHFNGTGNYEGTETLREVLDDIAEATQTIYYICSHGHLNFKRPDKTGDPVLTISKADYFTLKNNNDVTLSKIVKATQLGNNLSVTTGEDGVTQYVRDNPFWELLDDTAMATKLNRAIELMGGVTANQFNCNWRGNYLLEPVDKIALITKDGTAVTSYYINDKITYNGGLTSTISWEYANNEHETADNPANISDVFKKTSAQVDKINQRIELVVNDVTEQSEKLNRLEVTTDGISASVSSVEKSTTNSINTLNQTVESLSKEVNLAITQEEVTIAVQKAVSEGVNKVVTSSKKYTFDDTGLSVSSPDSNISTTITEDGVRIYRNSNEVLTADNEGVKAEDLHATTYLIIGENSRLEDWQNGTRTACFWIGG